jgi:hypothetical protein
MMKQNLRTLDITELEVHELAHLTPTMTGIQFNSLKDSIREHGQELPVITYRSKVIDGRHRLKAMRELGLLTILATSLDSQMSIEDIQEKILNIYENRRHQTPTQKAIMAYREYALSKKTGEKRDQGAIATRHGTTRNQLGKVKSLHECAGDEVIEFLFQGNKINTGTVTNPNNTDSLSTLVLFYKNRNTTIIENSEKTTINEDFTDEEIELSNAIIIELSNIHSKRMLERINTMLYFKIKG